MKRFLGQVPLVLGPGSWGFPGMMPPGGMPAPAPACPTGTVMAPDGRCRPTTTHEGGVQGQPERRTMPGSQRPG